MGCTCEAGEDGLLSLLATSQVLGPPSAKLRQPFPPPPLKHDPWIVQGGKDLVTLISPKCVGSLQNESKKVVKWVNFFATAYTLYRRCSTQKDQMKMKSENCC